MSGQLYLSVLRSLLDGQALDRIIRFMLQKYFKGNILEKLKQVVIYFLSPLSILLRMRVCMEMIIF